MTTFLLDVNVLIALVDPSHIQHDPAHEWFERIGHEAFATCPMTENGLVRIVGNPKYPNSPGPPSVVLAMLVAIRRLPGHRFWPDSITLADGQHVSAQKLSSHGRVTDAYLLALAKVHHGRLATMDQRLAVDTVPGGSAWVEFIGLPPPLGR